MSGTEKVKQGLSNPLPLRAHQQEVLGRGEKPFVKRQNSECLTVFWFFVVVLVNVEKYKRILIKCVFGIKVT